jgi:hypothetical protein
VTQPDDTQLLFDFSDPASVGDWAPIDDRVMGGSFRGREVAGAPALDPARIRQVGLMIAAKQAGPFALDMKRISLA